MTSPLEKQRWFSLSHFLLRYHPPPLFLSEEELQNHHVEICIIWKPSNAPLYCSLLYIAHTGSSRVWYAEDLHLCFIVVKLITSKEATTSWSVYNRTMQIDFLWYSNMLHLQRFCCIPYQIVYYHYSNFVSDKSIFHFIDIKKNFHMLKLERQDQFSSSLPVYIDNWKSCQQTMGSLLLSSLLTV